MPRVHSGEDVRRLDVAGAAQSDAPGIAQELTIDDIDDIAFDSHLNANERRRQLMGLLEEVRSRLSADFLGDMEAICAHLRDRIASLHNPAESQTLAETNVIDDGSRSDDDD